MQILYSSYLLFRRTLMACSCMLLTWPAAAQDPRDPAPAAQVFPNDHIFPAAPAARPYIDFDRKGFLVNGRRTFLVSAGIEYARVPHELWEDRLLRLKRAGFNCVEIYTFWNFHEPRRGVFDFKGDHDLDGFLKLVKRMGLYAIVRVGPYYCAEWDNGGYPLWLRFQPGVRVREHNPVFEKYTGLFFDRLIPIVAANQVNHGGPVILVQLENEHPAAWGTSMPDDYFRFLREKALSLGLEVPYFFSGLHHASDPAAESRRPAGVSDPAADPESLDDPTRPNPWLTTEFWSVWYDGYGSTEKDARLYERRTWKIIAHGGNGYNYYMAHGGTNFGYTNNDEDAASYDYGAAVGQGGDLRPVYYAFKRAALFARSFQEILANSEDATGAYRRKAADTTVKITARKSPAGTILFLDNPSAALIRLPFADDTLTLSPGEIRPVVQDYQLQPGIRLVSGTARILAFTRQAAVGTLLIYGEPGTRARLFFSTKDEVKLLKGAGAMSVSAGNIRLDAAVPADGHAVEYSFLVNGSILRVLVMSPILADRSWVLDDDGMTAVVCGPRYAGAMTLANGQLSLTTEEPWEEPDRFPVHIYAGSADWTLRPVEGKRIAPHDAGKRTAMSFPGWERRDGTIPAGADFDDSYWTHSVIPLQMGADGDGTADAWYRTKVDIDTPGVYTLLVEGSDRAIAFPDGKATAPFAIKNGEIPFEFSKGRHSLAIFTAHDGRDKLPAYIGPIDSADRKGLFGKALLVRGGPSIRPLEDWQVLKAASAEDVRTGPPLSEAAGWQPYKIGQDAFGGKQGFGWFRVRLPDPPAGAQQMILHFASVDENATVFVGGRRLLRHEGWNTPFTVAVSNVDTLTRPIWLTVFVENYSNEGGIDKPVRAGALLSPVAVTGWHMRGGTGGDADAAGWKNGVENGPGSGLPGPCWWRTSFRLETSPPAGMIWRVIPKGLGHGSIWVNDHNLGRYPEKIPVNGLYIPECWLKTGLNKLRIYDEDGHDARQVSIEVEKAASRSVTIYRARSVPGSLVAPPAALQQEKKLPQAGDNGVWRYVDPFIGTTTSDVETRWGSEGGTYPGAAAPSGFIQLTPETRPPGRGGYDYHDSIIYVFSCTHHNSGFPGGSSGRLFIMPVRDTGNSGRPFSHTGETAEPGYYRVRLEDDGTVVEVVATTRTGAFRIRYPAGTIPKLFVSDMENEKSAFDLSERYTDRQTVKGGQVFSFTRSTTARYIIVRVSASTVSAQSAEKNIAVESSASFDELRTSVRAQWQHVLSVVQIKDTNRLNKVVFYTALYHSLLVPWIISDVDGNYRGPDGRIHRALRKEYGNFSPWDSFRSLHPLLSLLYPDAASDMVRSMLDAYSQQGHLPLESMTGNHAIPIIVDACLKGIRGFDRTLAYQAMTRSLLQKPFLQQDMQIYRQKGYIPSVYPESVTRTVEYGYDDWALAEYARKVMGKRVPFLEQGYRAYRRLFYSPELLLLPRDGDVVKTNPGNAGYKEGDAWAYSYFAPQDRGGLIYIMGGDTLFATRLDSALTNGKIIFDNETVLQLPYLFNDAGFSWLTQKWVRSIMTQRYRPTPGGLPGNDDLGAMSSWYVFGALGFFPVCPGQPVYSIGSPVFRTVILRLASGKRLVIRAQHTGNQNSYVESISVDQRPYPGAYLSHALLMRGGEIVFHMAPTAGPPLRIQKRYRPMFSFSAPSTPSVQVVSGQPFPVFFFLRNKGSDGTIQVHVRANGKEIGVKNCLVAGGGELTDSILCRIYPAGRTEIRIGPDRDMNTVTDKPLTVYVTKPPHPQPEGPVLETTGIQAVFGEGDSIHLRFTAMNSGWEPRSFYLPVQVDDKVSVIDTMLLEPGEQKVCSQVLPAQVTGLHTLRIGNQQQTFKVTAYPQAAVVLDLSFEKIDTGCRIVDHSGFANRTALTGRPPTENSPEGIKPAGNRHPDTGILLDKDRYLSVTGSPSLDEMGTQLTMMLWVYPFGDDGHGLVDIFSKGDNHVLQVTDNRTLTFFAGGWGRGDVTVDLPPDWLRHWHHIAGVCSSDGLRLYVDGILKGYTALQKDANLSIRDIHWVVGRNEEFPGQRIYTGYVDRPKIFQAALPPADILSIYQKEKKEE